MVPTPAVTTRVQPDVDEPFLTGLAEIVGAEHLVTDLAKRVFFSTDIFTRGVTAEAVFAPGSTEVLAKAVKYCVGLGRSIVPRGGGFSYTQGYTPIDDRSVIVDLRRLDKILEINAEDLYVTVETGCTWETLYQALKAKGLRTPYFGPMSGFRSTIGGALSQGSFFLGSTQYGTTADSVLSLEVVLADGSVVLTGSAASRETVSPYFRNFGPDITGVFLHDSGAMGLKSKATLKLIPFPAYTAYATFAFDEPDRAVAVLSEIGRTGLGAECYLWDPAFGASLRKRNSIYDDIRYLKGVAQSGSSPFAGVADAVRLVLAGKSVFDGKAYLLHMTVDDVTEAGAMAKVKLAEGIAVKNGGKPAEPSAPRAMRGMPFSDFVPNSEANAEQRSLPTHGIFPHSLAIQVFSEVREFFAGNADLMAEHGITWTTIVFAIGANAVCVEPLFHWTDEQLSLHSRLNEYSDVQALENFQERPAAAQVVVDLRRQLVDLFARHGASHCQIGRSYPYRETRTPEYFALVQAMKTAVDPAGLINPGALGLA